MATERKRDAPSVRVIPPAVPVLTILAGFGLEYLWPIDLGYALAAPIRYWVGGLVVAVSILCLGLWPVVLFRRSGQSEIPWTPTTELVERGPYRLTRNPMYLQMVLGCLGVAVIFWNAWILILIPICAGVLDHFAIKPEEAYLEDKFGESYRAYKRRVRRWL